MTDPCVPYPRKGLYLLLSVPMILLCIAIAAYLWTVSIVAFGIYVALFVLTVNLQAYVCVHWQCPYVGRFAPCMAGFCLPASQIARLYRNVKTSESTYNVVVSIAFLGLLGIIFLPVCFLFKVGILYMLGYLAFIAVYAVCFLLFICSVCGTRHVCPGGQTATKLRESITHRGA